MARPLRIDRDALAALAASPSVRAELHGAALQVRGRARANARSISASLSRAIDVEDGADADGPFSDIGYRRDLPGFALWWHEVGTVNFPARPHLRPALQPGN